LKRTFTKQIKIITFVLIKSN